MRNLPVVPKLLKSSVLMVSLASLPVAFAQQEATTLTLVNSQWLDALRGEALWNAMLEYPGQEVGVALERQMIPSAEINTKLMTELSGGQAADLMIMQEGLFHTAAEAGFLADAETAVAGVDNLNATNDSAVVDGVRYGVAWQRAPYALIYNQPLIEQAGVSAPTSVDELIASASQMRDDAGVIGFTARHSMADYVGWYMDFQNWAYGYDVHWVNDEGELTINTPEAVEAIGAFKKAYDASIMPQGDDFPTQRVRFKRNQVAFSVDNSGGTLNIANGGALDSRDLGAAALPFAHPGAHQQLFIGVNAQSEHKEEALAFLAWLVSEPGQQALREASGPDTLATDVPVTDAFLADNPWAEAFIELGRHSRSTLIPGYELQTPAIMRTVMGAVERVIVGDEDPADALEAAQRRIDVRF
ncbi:ABC transporter substrate-binding protein [Vreelandella sp. EE7]